MIEHNTRKVSTPPHVHDASQPLPEPETATRPRPGVLVAVRGNPVDGASPVYIAALGYCVWVVPDTSAEFLTEGGEIVTEGGVPLTE